MEKEICIYKRKNTGKILGPCPWDTEPWDEHQGNKTVIST